MQRVARMCQKAAELLEESRRLQCPESCAPGGDGRGGEERAFSPTPVPESLHSGWKNCSIFSVFALVARNRTNEPTRRLRRQRYRCRLWIFRKT